MPGVAVLLIYR